MFEGFFLSTYIGNIFWLFSNLNIRDSSWNVWTLEYLNDKMIDFIFKQYTKKWFFFFVALNWRWHNIILTLVNELVRLTQFVRYLETSAPRHTIRWVLDLNALAIRQERPVVHRVPVPERYHVLIGWSGQVQFHRLLFVQVVVDEIDPYALADWKQKPGKKQIAYSTKFPPAQ